jgi:signal transduction histidine kinase
MRQRAMFAGPLRVALAATAFVAIVYVLVSFGGVLLLRYQLYSQVDSYLTQVLPAEEQQGQGVAQPSDLFPPAVLGDVALWVIAPDGSVAGASHGVLTAPPAAALSATRPTTIFYLNRPYRFYSQRANGYTWVIGGNVSEIRALSMAVAVGEFLLGIPILVVIFGVALWSGYRSAFPVEQDRKRQLAFTADASHELRTPLQVIEAETSLALLKDRDAPAYRETIVRVADEGKRLRSIVEDLLWLARFRDQPAVPESKAVDVREVAAQAHERFGAVAQRRDLKLQVESVGEGDAFVAAPPEWMIRLAGVLVDNACRYTPDGGTIRVVSGLHQGRVVFSVEDSGPGISPEQQARIFDRFYRASNTPGGAGLGLSIADSVVQATGGRWQLGNSAGLGGAHFEVSWAPLRKPGSIPRADTKVEGLGTPAV